MSHRRPNPEEAAHLQYETEHTDPGRGKSVLPYMVILIAAAFLLLLMALLMQRRQSAQATTDALRQSSSAVESIQNLLDENAQLRSESEALEERVAELEKKLSDAEAQGAAAQSQADRAAKAMGYFWQINEAYVRQRYSLCRELIGQFETDPDSGPAALPQEAYPADNGRFSPAERYQEIYDALY